MEEKMQQDDFMCYLIFPNMSQETSHFWVQLAK